jgi:hypothetical protein
MLIAPLPLLPQNAREISPSLAILDDGERVVFFNAAGPIYSCRKEDRTGLRLGAVTVVAQELAGPTAVAEALGLHRTTLFRDARRFADSGVDGLVEKRRGPKGPHALTPEVQRRAQDLLDRGTSIRATARSVGVSESGLRHAIDRGLLVHAASARAQSVPVPSVQESVVQQNELIGPAVRAAEDQATEAGVAVKRTVERALACAGKLEEAAPSFTPAEAVPGAGALLALPALLEQGLIDVGTAVYGQLRNGFFGLRSVLLTFAFMALLRIKTAEQLTEHAPGELGLLLGLDRAPEVKTLRRKLAEMGQRGLAWTFMRRFTERWAKAEPQDLALLYVDGHVRPYNGRKHALPKQHVQQRGRPMPGTKDFHVNDRRAEPLLFVTADANEGLLHMLDEKILPEIRELVGPNRRVIVAFDREGWSPDRFVKWQATGFDVLTYRKGKQPRWRTSSFAHVRGTVGGESVEYNLSERRLKLYNGLQVREIRRLTEDGHQTSVITTAEKLPLLAVAHRMFSRWRQENFFRYMRHEFALDHLCTHAVEPADPNRLVANPLRRDLERRLQAARSDRTKLIERRVDLAPGETVLMGKERVDKDGLDRRIQKREEEVEHLVARIAELPKRVPIAKVLAPGEVVQLERERKVVVDAIKLVAYRAESALARLVEPIFQRHEDEARKFLKTIFKATADLLPDETAKTLTVRFHGLASPRATRALSALCALINEDPALYPGTDLRLHFEAPDGCNNSVA